MCSTMIAWGKTLCPNANAQNNSWEIYAHSYITCIRLHIIESIATACVFSSCTSTDSYEFTHKDVFVPAYLSSYPIQVTLQLTPDNFVGTILVTKYTVSCQYAPHDIICFYIILQFYIKRHFCASLSPAPYIPLYVSMLHKTSYTPT